MLFFYQKISLFCLIFRFTEIIDAALERTLQPESFVSEDLSANDVFYREVSEVHLLLLNLIQLAVDQAHSDRPTQQIAQYILQINTILLVT